MDATGLYPEPFAKPFDIAPAEGGTYAEMWSRFRKDRVDPVLDWAVPAEGYREQHRRWMEGEDKEDVARRRLAGAAFEANRLNDQMFSRLYALERAADHRIDIVRDLTGEQLENPFRQGYYMDARRAVEADRARGADVRLSAETVTAKAREMFTERVSLAAERYPEKAAALSFGQTLEEQAEAIARAAFDEQQNAARDVQSPVARFGAALIGGMAGAMTDPIQIVGLAAGAGPATAATGAARIGQVALREAAVNAGLQAIEEPAVQQWRGKLGLPSGPGEAVENIALAGVLGGVFGGGVQGLREAFTKPVREALSRIDAGTATAADVEAVFKAAGVEMDEGMRAALRAADAVELDVAATAPRVKQAEPEAHAEAAEQAVRHALDPENEMPPIAPMGINREVKQSRLPDLRDEAPGGGFTVKGLDGVVRRVEEIRVNPARLETDAATFQYKEAGGEAGQTGRLDGVEAIAPMATGKMVVFERLDGVQVVGDGHQRAGLFRRLADDEGRVPVAGNEPGARELVEVPAYLFREADGWKPGDVRAIGAMKNIQEGSGSLMDAARVMRDRPDLFDETIAITRGRMQQVTGLANLSDDGWRMVTNGRIEPEFASLVGRIAHDRPELHLNLIGDMIEAGPRNAFDAEYIIRDALASGTVREVQETMFGAMETARTLLAERRQVLQQVVRKLQNDKRVFTTLEKEAGGIEAAGNTLDKGNNAAIRAAVADLSDRMLTVATRAGEVSDMLNDAARAVHAGTLTPAKAADDMVREIVERFRREGVGWLYAEPKLRPDRPIEPASREAANVVEAYSARELEEAVQSSMFGDAPKTERSAFIERLQDSFVKNPDNKTALWAQDGATQYIVPPEYLSRGAFKTGVTVDDVLGAIYDRIQKFPKYEMPSPQEGFIHFADRTPAGDQLLIDGVAPVTDRQRAELEAGKPLQGGDAAPPAGGLFDLDAQKQMDLLDRARDVDDAGARLDFTADLIANCKG